MNNFAAKLAAKNPKNAASVLEAAFTAIGMVGFAFLIGGNITVFAISYFLMFVIGAVGLHALYKVTQIVDDPMGTVQNMLDNVDINEMLALANQFFDTTTKPSGPIGVVDNERNP